MTKAIGIFHKLENISCMRNAAINKKRLNPARINLLICLAFNSVMSIADMTKKRLSTSKIIFIINLTFSIVYPLPSNYFANVNL
jgi:hypothetical protein